MRSFQSLEPREILALAIAMEEEDARVYDDFADGLRNTFPQQAEKFRALRRQEDNHRHRLLDLFRAKFGEHVPLIRREDIRGFVKRRPIWMSRPLGLKAVQKHVRLMELETGRFYETSARQATDAGIRQLLGDLAEEERHHVDTADALFEGGVSEDDATREKQLFALQVIQPGLAGLMDGSVSTLAPLFAAAFATHNSWQTFLVGLAASLGAGISMGFAEALSDDGTLTGRGHPWARGFVCGLMTTVGGIGHTLPYLIPDMQTATWVAVAVVCCELLTISWVRHKYMDTPWASAILQVVLGGALVFFVGILIGKA
ncbi:MAG TPA: ferritin family protein [Verrucomicrobiae bacterium]|jgi:rubrerythrin|nr:ferritin family protein [Verrucomicrobiae bacterium]